MQLVYSAGFLLWILFKEGSSSQHVLEISVLVLFFKSKNDKNLGQYLVISTLNLDAYPTTFISLPATIKKKWFKHQGYDLITRFSFQRTAGIKIRLPVCLPDIII